jgi:hypothetical protein
MASAASLRLDLASWDGKDADAIRAIYGRQVGGRGFVGSLIRLAGEADFEVAASWLIKHHVEQKASDNALSEAQADAFYRAAARFEHWEARLHALQIMEHAPVPPGSIRDAKRLIERCLADENKFVRAWAYSGFGRLAGSHPRYRAEAEALLADAEANESAASVRARIRQIRRAQRG